MFFKIIANMKLQRHLIGIVYLTMSVTAKIIPIFIQIHNLLF